MFGYLKANVNGYNLLFDNIQFSKYGTSPNYIDNKYGYLVGNNGGGKIQLVGVSRQHLESSPEDHFNKIAGKSGNYNYNGGYIIWADTLGNCTDTATAGTKQSDLTVTDKTTVTAKSPWVTVSPSINIGAISEGNAQVLTGDSIMSNFAAADALSTTTLADVNATAKTTYTNYRNGTGNKPKLFSTYETEMGAGSLPEGVSDFAVIAVDKDGMSEHVTNAFNSYVQMLTHNYVNFATNASTNVYNYRIKIYRCTYQNDKFTMVDGSDGLKQEVSQGGLKAYINHPDTDAQTACFTLVDVQFLNPANTSEVAYHVYVPVLIKKVMTMTFKASSLPGTVYDHTNYVTKVSGEDGWGTPSVTNLGTPVTVFFQYDYTSKVSEWQEMLDNGDSLMWHTNKKLLLRAASENLPSDTRMVLVDANDNDRAYYAKVTDQGVFTLNTNSSQNDYYIDLDQFKNGTDTFTSVDFGAKLPITATASTNTIEGKQKYVESGAGGTVCAMAKINGTGNAVAFRKYNESTDSGETFYYLTVDGNADDVPSGMTESYYITFFTDSDTAANLRVILFGSAAALSSASQYELPSHTFRCTRQDASALILGNIFKQEFTNFRTENAQNGLVNIGCNYFESDITVKITVNNDNGEAGTIVSYLKNKSIKIYHSILLTLTQNDGTKVDNMIYGTPTYTRNIIKTGEGGYGTIASTLQDSEETELVEAFSIDDPTNTSSFIQIQDSGFDIKPLLIETQETNGVKSYGGAIVTINGLRTHFDFVNIPNQFPHQPNNSTNIGTTVTAVSVLDSDQANVAYSNIRKTAEDGNSVKYHSEKASSASLVYTVDNSDETEIVQNYNLLGINPIDPPEYYTYIIAADGTYNAITFVDSAQAGKIRWTLSLEKKNENDVYEKVDMSKYLATDITISNRTSGGTAATFTQNGEDYIFDEDFTTPMDITKLSTVYGMKTGDALEAVEDGNGNPETGVYANYRVILSATLYTGTEDLTGLTTEGLSERAIPNSTKSQDIRYTNARVLSSWVNP